MTNVALHHRVEGSGRPLVVLHGGAGGISDLDLLRARLAPGRRVISPDQRSHGRSPDAGEISYAAMAADTAALLDGLDVRAADIVGWSDGGIIGLILARDRPDLVGRLVAISANLSNASDPPPLVPAAAEYLARVRPADLAPPDGRADIDPGTARWHSAAAGIIAMWRAGNDLSFEDLGGLGCPVLYIGADRDIVPLAHLVAMFEATPNAQLAIVSGADHRLPQQHADEVAGLVERFLGPGG
jgi:pimeloyl-ACP methyl ester carboxylesterase